MANTFKNATVVASTANADTYLYTAPAATTGVVHAVFISNIGDATIQVDVKMLDASAATTSSLVTNAPITPGGTFVLDKPVNLETLDSLVLQPDTANSTQAVASILQIT
jgi:hypothetical protein